MIKVINVITDTNIGGAGKCLLNFLSCYDREEICMEIFIPRGSKLLPEIENTGVNFTEVTHIADRSLTRRGVSEIYSLLKERKPDIVHTHAAMSARLAARLYGKCGIVNTRHSVFTQPNHLTSFPLKQINGIINNSLSDRIIAVSPAAKKNLTDTGTNSGKITVVFNGVSPAARLSFGDRAEVRKQYGLSESDYVLALIARLSDIKGHDYVLDAAKTLAETDKTIKILFAGTGDFENHLRRRILDENIPNVIMAGFVNEIYKIENIMDLQINASYGTEATSLSLLEGMSLGVPAVVSDFGGNPFVIKDDFNGIVVPQKDAAALAGAVMKIKNDSALYRRLSQNAITDFNENFTSQIMTLGITNVYRELAKNISCF